MAKTATKARSSLRPPPPRLPEPPTSFVGREREIEALRAAFERGQRLVTLLGPGGVGKTRLALRFAANVTGGEATMDVVFCDLSEATGLGDLCSILARTLGATFGAASDDRAAVAHLGRTLAARARTLLVLDNLEQIVADAAPAIADLLARAPDLRVLATSREILRATGEVVIDLDPLPVPDPADDAPERSAAVQLFCERARLVAPGWAEAPGDADIVAEIVRRLDGFPLAIELCATRGRVLDPAALLARLSRGEGALGAGPRDVAERHRSIAHVIDWSVRGLAPAERAAFAQCAVFAGGFTLDAAEAIVDLESDAVVLDVLSALVDKSLLRVSARRFSMYSAIRDHAARALAEGGGARAIEARHARHYLDLGERLLRERPGNEGRAALLPERDNLVHVHARALAGDPARPAEALRAALVLDELFEVSGPFREVFELLDASLGVADANVPAGLVARAVEARGRAHRLAGRTGDALRDHERAVALAVEHGDRAAEARATISLGVTYRVARRPDEARATGERAIEVCRALGDPRQEARARSALGGIHAEAGDLDRAAALLGDAEALAKRIGDGWTQAMAAAAHAHVLQEQGDLAAAQRAFERSTALYEAAADRRRAALCAGYLAGVLLEQGDAAAAHEGYVRAAAKLARFGNPRFEGLFTACSGAAAAALGRLDDARAAFDVAAPILDRVGDPALRLVLDLHRLHLEIAEGRTSEALARCRALTESSPLVAVSDDVRSALRVLHRALQTAQKAPSGATPALRVALRSRWFEPPGGPRTALDRKRALWLILHALADARVRSPGHVLSSDALIAAGWPDERVLPTAGAHRVRVAVATLRDSGLRGILLSRSGGYLLDPAAAVELIPD